MKRNHAPALVVLLLWFTQAVLVFNPSSAGEKPWTLQECLDWGLKNHPSIRSSEGSLISAKAQKDQNSATLAPKVSLSSSFTRQKQDFRRATSGLRIGTDDLIDSSSHALSYRQTITDWGRTKDKLRAGIAAVNAAEAEKSWQMIQVVTAIKVAFYQVLQAQALVKVQQDSLQRFQEHLGKVQGFVEVGSRPPYDVTKAQVDVANTRVSLIKAESTLKTSFAALVKAIGFEGDLTLDTAASYPAPTQPTLTLPDILAEAKTRPDLAAIRHQETASRHRLRNAKKGLAPTVSGSGGYSMSGTVTPLDRDWNAQISLSVPFLDGRLTKFQIRDAEGSLESAQSRVQLLEQAVRAEAETVLAGLTDAFQRLDATQVLLQQASESLQLAEGRYAAGLGSPLEVTDARVAYSSAEGNHFTALYDSYISLAKLDQVLGRFPAEVRPESLLNPDSPAEEPTKP